MHNHVERDTHLGSSRYGKLKKCCKIGLILMLKVFPAIFLSTLAFGSEYDYLQTVASVKASGSESLITSRRSLDTILQDYAFRAFVKPRTGIAYDAPVPSNMTGITLGAVRLRSGSLYRRGMDFHEFHIPAGVLLNPYVQRCALIYQNLGNWSGIYYPMPGYDLLGSVIGLLAYDSSNLSALNLAELNAVATKQPISIRFPKASIGSTAICVSFYLNGSVSLSKVSSGNVCLTNYQGHFGLFSKSLAPSPAPSTPGITPAPGTITHILPVPKKKESNTWKIVLGSVLGGMVLLVLLIYLVFVTLTYLRKAKITKMENQADQGEALQTSVFGSSRAPAAGGTRTQPMLENDYVA
ncbi:hypothetical protein SUGI_0507340 [Cryptomeria japonica]|nr:hypothetical protein SUGI_0507340 [Cryptomeria japonica]